MKGYNFTERTRKVISIAREVAQLRNHEYVGTEHLLLGIIEEGEGVAAAAIQALGVDLKLLAARIDEVVTKGTATVDSLDLPYTSRTKKVLLLAMEAAREHHHNYIGTEHVLLGLILEERGIAAQVLNEAGVTGDAVLAEIERLLGSPSQLSSIRPGSARISFATSSHSLDSGWVPNIAAINVEVTLVDGTIVTERFTSVAPAVAFLHRQNRRPEDGGPAH